MRSHGHAAHCAACVTFECAVLGPVTHLWDPQDPDPRGIPILYIRIQKSQKFAFFILNPENQDPDIYDPKNRDPRFQDPDSLSAVYTLVRVSRRLLRLAHRFAESFTQTH